MHFPIFFPRTKPQKDQKLKLLYVNLCLQHNLSVSSVSANCTRTCHANPCYVQSVALPRILKAAGGQIDPFWAMYAQHNVASVKDILGEHRIGHLSGSTWLVLGAVLVFTGRGCCLLVFLSVEEMISLQVLTCTFQWGELGGLATSCILWSSHVFHSAPLPQFRWGWVQELTSALWSVPNGPQTRSGAAGPSSKAF